jgi:PAS domain S-box-containing protein
MSRENAVNILLVDDQPGKLLSYQVMLEDLGENLLPASSAKEALAILLKTDVAVILIDVCMPELDGFELAKLIREHPRYQKIAIIFISAIHMSESDYLKGYEAGAVDYMSVPVVPELLRAKVRVFAELFRKTGQLQQLNADLEKRVGERTEALESSSAQLRRSEQGRGLALAAGKMGSWDWDVLRDEWSWDEGQRRIFGISRADVVPDMAAMRTALHPDDREKLDTAFAYLNERASSFEFECRIRRPDSSERWCRIVGAGIFDQGGKLLRVSGVTTDITHQKQAEGKQALLAREVDHRAKNALAVVQAIVRLARRDNVQDFIDGVEGRIKALAQTHELLSHARWEGADVLRLVLEELAPYQNDRNARITAVGPSVIISPENAQALAIALHELATNAAKYGSLSCAEGRVGVSWYVFENALHLKWLESGGPAVTTPQTRGFGTKIITASLADPRRGAVAFDWRPEGLVCELKLRMGRQKDWEGLPDETAAGDAPRISPPMSNILLVEDEILVGILMQEMLQEMGYSVSEPCRTLKDSLSAAASGQFDGAVLDMNLGGEAVYPVAELLTARNIPFAFVTGYAADTVDKRFSQVPVFQKPVTADALAKVIASWISQPKGATQSSPSPAGRDPMLQSSTARL